MKTIVLNTALLALALLGACGGGGDSEPTATESAADSGLPRCSEVWKVGETLNLDKYEGCESGDEATETLNISGCYDQATSDYRGVYASFEDRLWVVQEGASDQTAKGGTPGKVTDVDPKC